TGVMSADIGEPFNARVAAYAAIVAGAVVALLAFVWNLIAVPWRLHDEQAARLRERERRPDVTRLGELREEGIQLLNRPVGSDAALRDLQAALLSWEKQTVTELQKWAARSDVSSFRVLGTLTDVSFPGSFNREHEHEKMMLSERLRRLLTIMQRIEGGQR